MRIRGLKLKWVVVAVVMSGCASAQDPLSDADPMEPFNRQAHEFNKAVDTAVLRPISKALTGDGEGALGARVGDFADNLGKPGDIVNNLLQLRLIKAGENTLRFGFNTIFGLGGLFDVATAAGMPENDTDFGETLHIWGLGEGAYLELPLKGPTTERDLIGDVVDSLIDPVGHLLKKPESDVARAARIGSKIGERGRYSETVDSILYDSADSYAQTRLLYLQNRRHQLGQTSGEDGFVDPYEDPYGQ